VNLDGMRVSGSFHAAWAAGAAARQADRSPQEREIPIPITRYTRRCSGRGCRCGGAMGRVEISSTMGLPCVDSPNFDTVTRRAQRSARIRFVETEEPPEALLAIAEESGFEL